MEVLMKKVLVSSLLVLGITITLQTVVEAKGPKVAYTQEGMTALSDSNKDKVTTISIDEIQKSLEGKKPITVSFDIDDTLLFSSQYFQYGKEYVTPGSFDFLHKQKFWDLVAKRGDQDSIPKEYAKN